MRKKLKSIESLAAMAAALVVVIAGGYNLYRWAVEEAPEPEPKDKVTQLDSLINLARKLNAEQSSNGQAEYFIGNMYEEGENAPESYVHAYIWYSIAKADGYSDAQEKIDGVSDTLQKHGKLIEAQQLAVKCYNSDYKDCN